MCTETKETNKRKDRDRSSSESSPLNKRGPLLSNPTTPTAPATPTNKKRGNKIVHVSEPKEDWPTKLKDKLAPTTTTVILADSNMRLVNDKDIPRNTELHVFPGMKFKHATDLINILPRDSTLKTVVMSVGINHRDEVFDMTTGLQLVRMKEALDRRGSPNNYMLGVSFGTDLTLQQNEQMTRLNEEAEQMFQDNYITPFIPTEVTMRTANKLEIHHDQQTVNAVFDSILESLNIYGLDPHPI
jgi:hypothetical protein